MCYWRWEVIFQFSFSFSFFITVLLHSAQWLMDLCNDAKGGSIIQVFPDDWYNSILLLTNKGKVDSVDCG